MALTPFHHAFPVDDLDRARHFYGTVLGCPEGRSSDQWIDFDLFGHQIVAHLRPAGAPAPDSTHRNHVDGHAVPIPHFGVVLTMEQFDAFVVQDDLHENGKLELGESIADLGGLNLAYRALQKAGKGKKPAPIGGLTADQRFFLAFAQVWASNDRPEFERLIVTTDPHPLSRFRAIAAPANMPEFARAFECKEGDAMARSPAIRCQIW